LLQQLRLGHVLPVTTRVLVAVFLSVLVALTCLGGTAAEGKVKKAKVTVKIVTKKQAGLLKTNRLAVRVKANRRGKVRVQGFRGKQRGLFRAKRIRVRAGKRKTVKLKLTRKGRKTLRRCGAQTVRVKATFRGTARKAKRRAKATTKRRLSKWASRCRPVRPVDPPVEPQKALCDPLDPAVCLQPWPSNYHTRPASTPTGLRLDLPLEAMPKNAGGKPIDQTDMNRADGFSPGNLITLKIPEVDTPAAFANTGFVPITDLRDYARADQPVVVIDAATGERQPIWAELDSNPTSEAPTYGPDPDGDGPLEPPLLDAGGINVNPGNNAEVNLIVRPAKNFTPGHRYIVAFRNLKNAAGAPVEAPEPFRLCRDEAEIKDPAVLYRCNTLKKDVFPALGQHGIARDGLYMAWDFTVASTESLTGRALSIRDDAFERLGDEDLSDLQVEGESPEFTIDRVDNYTPAQNPEIMRHVRGRLLNVPCYLNQDGCPTGSTFSFDAQDRLTWNPEFTTEVPFRCNIPRSAVSGDEVVESRPSLYGHGLLGSLSQVNSPYKQAFEHNVLFCAVNWAGFSSEDVPSVISSLVDLSNFNKATDRMQQGFVNFMMVGRAMIHPQGFNTDPAFQIDLDDDGPDPGVPVIDTERLYYEGKSQGGIMGGALTALAPDFERAVLNVPGMNYSTLLQRSVDFDQYAVAPGAGLYPNYPDLGERQLVLSLMQLLWDRGEPNGYAQNMTDNPLPDTPEHQVLFQVDVGDHQVANVTAEVAARTVGAKRLAPTLDPGRHWEEEPFFGIDPIESFPYEGSVISYWDGGPVGWSYTGPECDEDEPCLGTAVAPPENVPPRPEWGYGGDPHNYSRDAVAGRQQASDFKRVDGFVGPCPNNEPCYANGWTGPDTP
jgi:hypothetical protein